MPIRSSLETPQDRLAFDITDAAVYLFFSFAHYGMDDARVGASRD